MLRRPVKQGIGPAYRDGFRRALAEGAGLVVEMDCDFSHDPARLPGLIGGDGADLVLGSRYVPGGGRALGPPAPGGQPRRCLYAQVLLGVPVRDLTGGFKCFRREVLEAIPLDEVTAAGLRLPDRDDLPGDAAGLPGREVPITFTERVSGASKMSRGIVWEAASLVAAPAPRLGRQPRGRGGPARGRAPEASSGARPPRADQPDRSAGLGVRGDRGAAPAAIVACLRAVAAEEEGQRAPGPGLPGWRLVASR